MALLKPFTEKMGYGKILGTGEEERLGMKVKRREGVVNDERKKGDRYQRAGHN